MLAPIVEHLQYCRASLATSLQNPGPIERTKTFGPRGHVVWCHLPFLELGFEVYLGFGAWDLKLPSAAWDLEPAAATTFCAASAKSSAAISASPLSLSSCFPFSTFV